MPRFLGDRNIQKDAKTLRVMLAHAGGTGGATSNVVMGGSEWTYGGSMTIDANSGADTVVYILNDGGGAADLNVEGDIVVGGLVDGVDVANHKARHRPSGADAIATAAATTLTVATTNAEGTGTSLARNDHTHAVTTSANPGAAAAILASDASGHLTLVQVKTDTLADKSGGNLTISPAGDIVFNPTGNDLMPASGYDLNLGSLAKKYLTLHAAELWVETLVAQNTIATIGGRIVVGPTTKLAADLGDGAGDTTITVEHNQIANGDRLVMQANGKLEWLAVTSAAGGAGPYTYTVTRNLDGTGRNLWYAGDALLNTGTTGDGFIDLYSVNGITAGSTAGPTIVGNVRYGTTYNEYREAWAIGNLNGLYGYGTDTYGVGLGQYSAADYITIDPTNGVRFLDADDAVKAQLTGGEWTIGPAAAQHVSITADDVTVYDDSGAAVFNAGASGNWLSALTVSSALGDALFSAADGLALWGPNCAVTATSWTSTRGQVATISGAFHQEQGAWAGTRGLVIEQAATNYVKDPRIGNATLTTFWTNGAGAAALDTFERSTTRAFRGTHSLHCVAAASGDTATYKVDDIAASNSQAWTLSCRLWVESGSVRVRLNDNTGAMAYADVSAATTWQRVVVTGTTAAAGVTNVYFSFNSLAAAEWYVDTVQMEKRAYATSYADGSMGSGYVWAGTADASTSTRSGTEVNLDAVRWLIHQKNTLTISTIFQVQYAAGSQISNGRVWEARYDATNRILLYYNSAASTWRCQINSGATTITLDSAEQTFAAGDWLQVDVSLDFSNNSHTLYVNGAWADTDTTAASAPSLSQWNLGTDYTGSANYGNVTIGQYAVFDRVLTAEEIAAMYARGRALVDTGATTKPGVRILDGDFELATATSGARWHANTDAIRGYDASGNERYHLGNDGSGWLGDSDTFAWDDTGIVAFKASGLIEPWEAPNLLDALYLPNAGGGGEQMFAWESISHRLQTAYGSTVWLVIGGPYYTSFLCTDSGGPYYDFSGGANAMIVMDGGTPSDGWQEAGANTFLVWAWVNADTLATTDRVILSKWDSDANRRSWMLYWNVAEGKFAFSVSSAGSAATSAHVYSSITESTGVWYFVAGFFNPSTLLRIYVGAADGAMAVDSNTTSIPAECRDATTPLMFGQCNGTSPTGFWDGKIGVNAAWRGLPAASVNDYAALLFTKTKQYYQS